MFYDFNNSTAQNTAENFFKAGDQKLDKAPQEGDRVPTRERGGYRSAHLNYRRRGG